MVIQDRRSIKDRRILTPVRRSSADAGSLVVAILPPEEQAAQVERIYERVPREKREEIRLNYEHVRAILDALR